MLAMDAVTYRYANGHTDAVCDVTLTVAPGERVCLLGSNGCGKSTIARLACGDIAPVSGSVTVDGLDPMADDARGLIALVRQDPKSQLVSPIVSDEVAFGPRCMGLDAHQIGARVAEALEACGIAALADRRVSELSGGQQQLVVVAGALALHPRYLVLDEASAHLDGVARAELAALVERVRARGVGVLQVTHDVREVRGCSRIVVMRAGRLFWQGSEEQFMACDEVRAVAAGDDGSASPIDLSGVVSREARTLALRQVVAGYEQANPVLRDISLVARPGELVLLCGSCGSGKSTAGLVLAGLLEPTSGNALLGDKSVRAGQVGLAFQRTEDQLFAQTVLEDVSYGPRNLGIGDAQAQERAKAALAALGVPEALWDRHSLALSGGQQRRVALAGILALAPHAFVFDEPTAGLDGSGRSLFHQVVAALLGAGSAVVLVTHDPDEWRDLATRTLWLSEGRLVTEGEGESREPTREVRPVEREPRLRQLSSALGRLDARVRMAGLLMATIALLGMSSMPAMALAAALVMAHALGGSAHRSDLVRTMRAAAPLLAFVLVAHTLRVDGSGTVALFGAVGVSASGAIAGVVAAVRIVLLLCWVNVCTADLSAPELADAMGRMLRPLASLGVPVTDASMVISVTLSFAAQVMPEFLRLERSQCARGARFDEGSVITRLRCWSAVLIPLVVLLFDRADALAHSMRLRGYRGQMTIERRPLMGADWRYLCVMVAISAAITLL